MEGGASQLRRHSEDTGTNLGRDLFSVQLEVSSSSSSSSCHSTSPPDSVNTAHIWLGGHISFSIEGRARAADAATLYPVISTTLRRHH